MDKVKLLKMYIKDERLSIEKVVFKSRKIWDDKLKQLRTLPETTVENCFIIRLNHINNTITHYVTIYYECFTIERIVEFFNIEISIFNKKHNSNIINMCL